MNEQPSGVDELVAQARSSREVRELIVAFKDQMVDFLFALDGALSGIQPDPMDVGERVKRAIVVRGTVESVMTRAFEEKMEKEKGA